MKTRQTVGTIDEFMTCSLRSKRFQSSYCAKVKAGGKKEKGRQTRAETLATQTNDVRPKNLCGQPGRQSLLINMEAPTVSRSRRDLCNVSKNQCKR